MLIHDVKEILQDLNDKFLNTSFLTLSKTSAKSNVSPLRYKS